MNIPMITFLFQKLIFEEIFFICSTIMFAKDTADPTP
jgi:hypothetical protein